MTGSANSLADALHERVGDTLRVVGFHEDGAWRIDYMRDDLQGTYETDVIDEIADDLLLNVVANDRQEALYELGDLQATVRLFDDGFIVHVPTGDHAGCLISLDDDADVRGRDVVDLVREVEG